MAFFLDDLFGGVGDFLSGLGGGAAEAAPAVAGGIEGAGGLGDFLGALPGAGSFGGFAPEQAFSAIPGAGETLPGFTPTQVNPLAFSATSPFGGETAFIGAMDNQSIPTPPIPPGQEVGLAGDPRNLLDKITGGAADKGLFGGVGDFLGEHPTLARSLLPAGAIGLGLARQAMSGQTPGLGAIKDIAGQQTATAKQLAAPLLSGAPLPSGLQAQIDQSKAANEAKIRQQYGSMGLSGSTMEAQALQQNEMAAAQAYTQQALSLYGASAQALGIANQADMTIMQDALMKDNQMAQLIASVAQAGMYGAMKS